MAVWICNRLLGGSYFEDVKFRFKRGSKEREAKHKGLKYTKVVVNAKDSNETSRSQGKRKPFYAHGRKPEDGKGRIPMLKSGKGKPFYKFKEALPVASIETFGNLGRLIKEKKCSVPVYALFVMPTGTDAEEQTLMKVEHVKKYTKEIGHMGMDCP
jgi:hypothetical protein